jgi:hypothetical protein
VFVPASRLFPGVAREDIWSWDKATWNQLSVTSVYYWEIFGLTKTPDYDLGIRKIIKKTTT